MFPVERKGDVVIQAFPELRPDTGFKELRSETGFPRKGRDEHRFPGWITGTGEGKYGFRQ